MPLGRGEGKRVIPPEVYVENERKYQFSEI